MENISKESLEKLREISRELREQRMRCNQCCGAWDSFDRDCYIFGSNHPAPSRCEYYLEWELKRRQNLEKKKMGKV